MKLILPAREIPGGSTVTKVTGNVTYVIRDSIKVYGTPEVQQEIKAIDGVRFIVNERGDINAVSGNTELAWVVSTEQLGRWLDDLDEDDS